MVAWSHKGSIPYVSQGVVQSFSNVIKKLLPCCLFPSKVWLLHFQVFYLQFHKGGERGMGSKRKWDEGHDFLCVMSMSRTSAFVSKQQDENGRCEDKE
jgi:hypothetical protein